MNCRFSPLVRQVLLLASLGVVLHCELASAEEAEVLERGAKLYAEKCLMCHQPTGLGAPPVFPPLAGSEWVSGDRTRLIKVLCEGLAGKITVRGQVYDNVMPAQILDDAEVAAVLTYVGRSWGNKVASFGAEEVALARARSRYKTYAELVKTAQFQPLPKPPAGWELKELAPLPEFVTRMAGDGRGVYLLGQAGNIYALDQKTGVIGKVISTADYLDAERGDVTTLGMTLGPDGRLWVTSNQKLTKDVPVYTNEVVIWRSAQPVTGSAGEVKLVPWLTHRYPQGVGGFNHGVSHLAFGPDGWLYVSSGSRTDGGEIGKFSHYAAVQEVETTACLWRLDPRAEKPMLEVMARGIRNAYAFGWDEAGNLFTFSNGPDYDAGEEMDFIEPGKHYGFPYQYEDWPVRVGFPYAHTPAAPDGVSFTHPVENVGPDGGFTVGKVARTLTPHSSPGGVVWCGPDVAAPLGGSFLVPRFGNLLAKPEDCGFDLLRVKPRRRADGTWEAEVHTVLAPLGRPLDSLVLPGGRVLILEYTRPVNFKDRVGWLPGRILELAPTKREGVRDE